MKRQVICECRETAMGKITVACEKQAICRISFGEDRRDGEVQSGSPLIDQAFLELEEYFRGERRTFDLPLNPVGTEFQKKVWSALQTIPCGETRSYGEIAAQVGNPGASRAVGMANNKNPIAIMVPCHRVIGKNGSLTGYAGGLELKRKLLDLESSVKENDIQESVIG